MNGVVAFLDRLGDSTLQGLGHVGGMARFSRRWLYWAFIGPFRERTMYRPEIFELMEEAGNKSLPVVALVSFLIGIILVYGTDDVMRSYGATGKIPVMVAVSITRELGPLMTAIMVIARVGSSYTSGLGLMKEREEIIGLETMAINPIGFLVAPRAIALMIMMPALTVVADLLGIFGGSIVSYAIYSTPLYEFMVKAFDALKAVDLISGVLRSVIFAFLIVTVTCYMAFVVRGGPKGVMRNTQRAVVSAIVVVIFADSIISAIVARFFL